MRKLQAQLNHLFIDEMKLEEIEAFDTIAIMPAKRQMTGEKDIRLDFERVMNKMNTQQEKKRSYDDDPGPKPQL